MKLDFPSQRQRFEWLIGFLRMDPDAMTPGGWLDAHQSALGIAISGPTRGVGIDEDDLFERSGKPVVPTPDQQRRIRDLQTKVKIGLASLLSGRPWPISPINAVEYVPRDGEIVKGYPALGWRAAFVVAAADLLAAHWAEVRVCSWKNCARPFIRSGKRKFCTLECERAARWAGYQSKRKPRNYQSEYRKRVIRKTGSAKVRIKHRKEGR